MIFAGRNLTRLYARLRPKSDGRGLVCSYDDLRTSLSLRNYAQASHGPAMLSPEQPSQRVTQACIIGMALESLLTLLSRLRRVAVG